MSIHSRSSSEVETTPYGEILRVFFKDFRKDFEFSDVKENVRTLFNDSQFDYIAQETGDAQIFHLLWVLEDKSDKIILKFLDAIAYEYKWIVDKIRGQLHDHSNETTTYLEQLKRIQLDYQKHTDFNIHRTKPFINLRSALRKLNPKNGSASVILLGELGSGKKWLALDVCSDFAVLRRMNFKIFWIDCIYCVTAQEDYNALKTLMIKLNPSHQPDDYNISTQILPYMILKLKEQIKHQLESKEFGNCLLVLANVQNVKCQEAFNLGCKRLIITRNKKVSESLSKKLNTHLTLDEGLSYNEFNLLLDKYIKSYNWRKDMGNFANDIYHMSNGDPYMLSIISKNLQEKKSNWIEWKKHLDSLQIPDYKFKRDIENSLKILTADLLQLYATFAVFPYSARIPVKLLATLWNMDLHQAEVIVNKLHINSFVKKEILDDNDTIVCSLKYVYSSYIKNCTEIKKLINPKELHRKIVEYYQVEENLNIRKDVDLYFGAQHDCYFFRCIGYHLYGAKYNSLFPKLYMDFGFLGQKMRSVGLANTIADLRDYENEILQGDTTGNLIKKLIAFLAKIEEKILHAHDCCLLQYALLAEEPVRELALQQIEKFPYRIWFSESGQFHQRRFIISLTKYAKLIRILESDICVVVLFNNDTFLVDISLDSICGPVQLIDATSANITEIKTFNHNNHLLTLDNYGQLNLWKIEDVKRRMLAQRRDAKTNFNPNNFKICPNKISSRPFKQSINDRINSLIKRVVAFYLENPNTTNCVLHVALNDGKIMLFDWNPQLEEFEPCFQIPLKTKISNIHSICKIKTHYMIMDYENHSSSMNVTFLKLRNTEKEHLNCDWPKNTELIYYETYNDSIVLVFTHCIVRLNLQFQPQFDGQLDVLYENPYCAINCAKLCLKNQYLVLGTEKGLQVLDIRKGAEILQSIVSENIRCVDNYDLDDEEYQTMIVCGIDNKNLLYLFGLRKVNDNGLVWEHSCLHSAMEKVTLEEQKNTRFVGQKLFDITEDSETLYAVDSKNRIHQICCSETKNWSIIPSPDAARKITAISAFNKSVYVAFENGQVFDLHQQRCIVKSTHSTTVEYLKIINDNILITSSSEGLTCITHIDNCNITNPIFTKYCAMVMEDYLLIVNNYGTSIFFNSKNKFTYNIGTFAVRLLADCDLKCNVLFLGFSSYAVHIYSLEKTNKGIECNKRCELRQNGNDCTITCLTASPNAKLFAIGLNTTQPSNNLRSCGDIEVFKLDESYKEQLLYCLKSHTNPVYDMMFSPHNDILVSISEQICFWNINFILNNPLIEGNTKRHSSRFNSQKSTEEVDANVFCNQRKNKFLYLEQQEPLTLSKTASRSFEQAEGLDVLNDNVFESSQCEDIFWPSFRGPGDKPELLSCLKLDGNEAKQIFANENFTQFFTIDDEGVYYNLRLIKPPKQISPDSVDYGDNSSSSSDVANDNLYIHRLSIASSSSISGTDVVDDANT